MAKYLNNPGHSDVGRIYHALSDPTRRAVVEILGRGPVAMSVIAAHFKIALSSFSKHLDVLEESGLVRSQKFGRVRTFQLNPVALAEAEGWLSQQRRTWEVRLDQLDEFLLEEKTKTLGNQ